MFLFDKKILAELNVMAATHLYKWWSSFRIVFIRYSAIGFPIIYCTKYHQMIQRISAQINIRCLLSLGFHAALH